MKYTRTKCYVLVILLPLYLYAQENGSEPISQQQDSLAAKQDDTLLQLQNRLHHMQQQRKGQNDDRLDELLRKAQAGSKAQKVQQADEVKKFTSTIRQQSALNPNISIGGDYYVAYGSSQSEYNRVPSELSWGTGQFFLREMELGVQAPLDPFSRAKVFLSFGNEGVALEEGYGQWLNLPLGMNLKFGQIKTQFGKLNRFHDHALPQFDRPLVLVNYFGNTGLKGLGLGANFLLPSITAQVNELDLEVISGGVGQSFTDAGKHRLIYVAHLNNYYDLNKSTYFEFGVSGALGHHDPSEKYRTVIGGGDLTLKWTPPGRSKYKGMEWRTEMLFSSREYCKCTVHSWGLYSYIQYRLGARWLCSVRMDYSQLPYSSNLEESGGAFTLDFWQSEFVFLRFQVTHINRNFDEDDSRVILQTNWAMGPHKHEAY